MKKLLFAILFLSACEMTPPLTPAQRDEARAQRISCFRYKNYCFCSFTPGQSSYSTSWTFVPDELCEPLK